MSTRKPYNQERLGCGCYIESPAYKNRWRVVERGESCRLHIVGEKLNIPSGRYRTLPR